MRSRSGRFSSELKTGWLVVFMSGRTNLPSLFSSLAAVAAVVI